MMLNVKEVEYLIKILELDYDFTSSLKEKVFIKQIIDKIEEKGQPEFYFGVDNKPKIVYGRSR